MDLCIVDGHRNRCLQHVFFCESSANYRFSLRKLHIFISFLSISFRFAPFLFANYSKQIDKGRQQQEENDNCSTIFLVPHHSKNFISLRYFFTVESALELIEQLNKELKSGLKAGGSTIHALLSTTTCKKKLYHQNFATTV